MYNVYRKKEREEITMTRNERQQERVLRGIRVLNRTINKLNKLCNKRYAKLRELQNEAKKEVE